MVPSYKQRLFFDAGILARHIRSLPGKTVWTNGCFDLLHEGHLYSLKQAGAIGDMLIIGLNSDSSVRRLKGENRPVEDQNIRAGKLLSLPEVDYVVIFEESTASKCLEVIRPQIYCKGAEYDLTKIPEAQVVKAYGGHIVALDMLEGISTTLLFKNKEVQ